MRRSLILGDHLGPVGRAERAPERTRRRIDLLHWTAGHRVITGTGKDWTAATHELSPVTTLHRGPGGSGVSHYSLTGRDWLDRHRIAATVRGLLAPGRAVVHVHVTTHEGIDTNTPLLHPRPRRGEIARLVASYLGTRRRAGQGVLTAGTHEDEAAIYRAAGFTGPQRLEVPGRVVERSVDEIVASVYSLSGSAPHLFGDRLERFDAELHQLLDNATSDGRFSEQMREIAADIWH